MFSLMKVKGARIRATPNRIYELCIIHYELYIILFLSHEATGEVGEKENGSHKGHEKEDGQIKP